MEGGGGADRWMDGRRAGVRVGGRWVGCQHTWEHTDVTVGGGGKWKGGREGDGAVHNRCVCVNHVLTCP